MLLRDRILGGVSFSVLRAPDDGTGAGAAAGADAGAAAAAGTKDPAAGAGTAAGAGAAADAGKGADKNLAAAGGGDPPAGAPQKFPDNWREHLAGEDKTALDDLKKYTDPNSVYKSLRSLQGEISSGKLKRAPEPLPANASDEQKTAFRTQNGLPDKAELYVEKIALPDGVVIGETDKPLVGDFAKLALDKGWSQGQFNEAVGWFYQAQQAVEAQREQGDGVHKIAAATELAAEWGNADYKVNMNAMGTMLATMPDELRNGLLSARLSDGRMLGNTPEFIKWAAAQARELNPVATLIPAGSTDGGKVVSDEIKQIESKMYLPTGQPNPEYWRDEKMQSRYRELTDAQQRMAARGSRAA